MPILCASQAPSYAWNLAGRLGFEIISIIQTSLPLARYKINRPSSNTWSLLILQNFMFKRLVTCTSTIYLDMSTRLDTQTGTVSLTTRPKCLLWILHRRQLSPTPRNQFKALFGTAWAISASGISATRPRARFCDFLPPSSNRAFRLRMRLE